MGTQIKIVAIGGGELRTGDTLSIDRRIVELTGKNHPNALFIPTASGDSERYAETFAKVYQDKLGCKVKTLKLLAQRPSRCNIQELIRQADLVYVGGGNTSRMMRRWRATAVDAELVAAAARGVVLAGVSAGAICWFRYGDSDSRSYSGSATREHIRVKGLGIVPLTYCPHYRSEKREKPLAWLIAKRGGRAIACDDNAAIEIVGDNYRIITSRTGAKAYLVRRIADSINRQLLPPSKVYRPLSELTNQPLRGATAGPASD